MRAAKVGVVSKGVCVSALCLKDVPVGSVRSSSETRWCCGTALGHIAAAPLCSQRDVVERWRGEVNVAKRGLSLSVCPRYSTLMQHGGT